MANCQEVKITVLKMQLGFRDLIPHAAGSQETQYFIAQP